MILNAPVYCLGLGFSPVHANNNYPQNYLALTIKQDCFSGPDGRQCKHKERIFIERKSGHSFLLSAARSARQNHSTDCECNLLYHAARWCVQLFRVIKWIMV